MKIVYAGIIAKQGLQKDYKKAQKKPKFEKI